MQTSGSYILFDETMQKLKCMAQKFGTAAVYDNIHLINGTQGHGRKSKSRQVYVPVGSKDGKKIYLGTTVSPRSYKFEFPYLLEGEKPGHLSGICVSEIPNQKKEEFKKNAIDMFNELENILTQTFKPCCCVGM